MSALSSWHLLLQLPKRVCLDKNSTLRLNIWLPRFHAKMSTHFFLNKGHHHGVVLEGFSLHSACEKVLALEGNYLVEPVMHYLYVLKMTMEYNKCLHSALVSLLKTNACYKMTLREPAIHALTDDLRKKSLTICFMWFPLFQHEHICIGKTSCSQVLENWSLSMWKARELQHCLVWLTADANEEQSHRRKKQPHLVFVIELLESYDPYSQLPPRKFSFINFEIILCQKHKHVSFRRLCICIATFCLGPICTLN